MPQLGGLKIRVPELYRFPALLATVRGGRVTGLVVTVEAEAIEPAP